MMKLKVKNFGPIKNGFTQSEDGFFEVGKLSIFVGNQGAGKSTIAKLISSLLWVEKVIFSSEMNKNDIATKSFFKKLLAFHKIESYYSPETQIEFEDQYLKISIIDEKIQYEILNQEEYIRPQIQYIPAERNVVSVVNRFSQLRMLPDSLQNFLYAYDDAIRDTEMQNVESPIENLKVRYNKRNNKVEVFTNDYSLGLDSAASGFQSSIPLFIVSKYFSDSIKKRRNEYKFKSLDEEKKFYKDYSEIMKEKMNEYSKKTLEPFFNIPENDESFYNMPVGDEPFYCEPKTKDGDTFQKFLNRTLNSRFCNIVEEPELNLFPDSQKNITSFLIECLNGNKNNNLIITTHSPYILETINNSIYAALLQKKGIAAESIVPLLEQIEYENVSAYMVKNGDIFSIKVNDLKQINPSEIDKCSEEINTIYSKLIDMEVDNEN